MTNGADLIHDIQDGNRRALAQTITMIENGTQGGQLMVRRLANVPARAQVIGITGPPGAGKSSLVSELAQEYRRRNLTIAIVAVDPTSPFSGGAILGDRVRMSTIAADPGIFMRSMATRGALGGLAAATHEVVIAMNAAGFDRVVVETVGVGQAEVDIVDTADTTVVVAVPGMGDEVQAIKAGILEIADVFVINKADQGKPDLLEKQLQLALSMPEDGGWMTPILRTVATRAEGIPELVDTLEAHHAWLESSGTLAQARRRRTRHYLAGLLDRELHRRSRENTALLDRLAGKVARQEMDPYLALSELLEDMGQAPLSL